MTTDDDLIALLRDIKGMALSRHPLPDDNPIVDNNLLFALGTIAGIAVKAIVDHDKRRLEHKP